MKENFDEHLEDIEQDQHNRNNVSLSHSFSYDGYERLHDEAMDKTSVSIHYSDYEEAFINSQKDLAQSQEKDEMKKMKIRLSQEQLKLHKNFLTVPVNTQKPRSASFSSADRHIGENPIQLTSQIPVAIVVNAIEAPEVIANTISQIITVTPPKTDDSACEIIYDVPRKHSLPSPRHNSMAENEIKTSSASMLLRAPSKSVANEETTPRPPLQPLMNFKYPLSFYCKICNDFLNDPRVLECLHSFCFNCLMRLDASNNLQNNQFCRKISDSSCKLFRG